MPVPLHDYLRRLPPEYYRGQAFVHWSMTIDGRATGWLDEETHLRFRDVQAHLLHRYRLMCPMYCLMPDHVHVFWAGLDANSDQLKAVRFLRDHFNGVLRARGVALQKQCHDNVLREIDRDRGGCRAVGLLPCGKSRAGWIEWHGDRVGLFRRPCDRVSGSGLVRFGLFRAALEDLCRRSGAECRGRHGAGWRAAF